LAAAISSPSHSVWQWLDKRSGRIAGLRLELRVDIHDGGEGADQLLDWMQPLQTLSGIPGVQLRVEWVDDIVVLDHPCIAQLLTQHGQLISHLTVKVDVSQEMLKLRDFCEAVSAPCRSIDLTICHAPFQLVDLVDLAPLAGSLHGLTCKPSPYEYGIGSVRSVSAFNRMSQLTVLRMKCVDLGSEEPWHSLAKLTSLRYLDLQVVATGDPSPLSALTRLSSLSFQIQGGLVPDGEDPSSFSSLQPLSTLRQLKELRLEGACSATSLHGLAGLTNLKLFALEFESDGGVLRSLEGISPGVEEFSLKFAPSLVSLAGIEVCRSMRKLSLLGCGVMSLQPLQGLSSMAELDVFDCSLTSLEGLNSLPLLSLSLNHCSSLTHLSGVEHLSTLKSLVVDYCGVASLQSLSQLGEGLQSLSLTSCSSLTQLSGVEHLSALKSLEVEYCGVTSLQPLSQLREGLQKLRVLGCKGVQEEILELPHVQPTANVVLSSSNVKEVVLAGGLRWAV
jgi:hypothetical protein